jgi:hypothetical protein
VSNICARDLQRAFYRRFRARVKDQCHAIASGIFSKRPAASASRNCSCREQSD